MSKPIHLFYTLYAVNDYFDIFKEQFHLLVESGLYKECSSFQIFAYFDDRDDKKEFKKYLHDVDIRNKCILNTSKEQHAEYNALNALYHFSRFNECNILYFHSKGVTSERNILVNPYAVKSWRGLLNYFNIELWRQNIEIIESGTHLSGAHYIWHTNLHANTYNGNFWWARSDYIKNLLEPSKCYWRENGTVGPNTGNDVYFLSGRGYAEIWVTQNPHKWHNTYSNLDDPYFIPTNNYRLDDTISTLPNKVTFVTRIKDMSDLLPLIYESLISQTSQDWNWLIYNNHSTDNLSDMVTSFNDVRIKLFNLDVFSDFWKEISNDVETEIIYVLDADDVPTIDAVQYMKDVFSDQNIDLSIGTCMLFDPNSFDGSYIATPTKDLINNTVPGIHPIVFRRDVLKRTIEKHKINYPFVDDSEITNLMIYEGAKYCLNNKCTYYYRMATPRSFSTDSTNFYDYMKVPNWVESEKGLIEKMKNFKFDLERNYKGRLDCENDFILLNNSLIELKNKVYNNEH